jgi:hypothetical protein
MLSTFWLNQRVRKRDKTGAVLDAEVLKNNDKDERCSFQETTIYSILMSQMHTPCINTFKTIHNINKEINNEESNYTFFDMLHNYAGGSFP